MKKLFSLLMAAQVMLILSGQLFSQSEPINKEFGITAGAFTNFPANQHYLTESMSAFYLAPYVRAGQHEFSAGIVYPLNHQGLYFSDNYLTSRVGAVAGYKFYVFDIYGRENLFIHYSFQYLRFKKSFDVAIDGGSQDYHLTETDMYINNVIGLGYNLFFDMNERFGLYYTLDYVISQTGFRMGTPETKGDSWTTQYAWNNISTNIGFIFKLGSLSRKVKK